VVLFFNLQAAVSLAGSPARYAAGFELQGRPGEAAVLGMAVLFVMWNVPYAVALSHPVRHRISLYEALAMQFIGLTGESLIVRGLPDAHVLARSSIHRFIAFDAFGLVCLLLALACTRKLRS
jgi:hypothetical protein